jgi:antitoxin component of RelBE/YafQ-DinJ toxin-antitoxin module
MAKAISVRLDDDAERALRTLEASGLTRSEAIRTSLLASADREEMAAVVELMEALRAPR